MPTLSAIYPELLLLLLLLPLVWLPALATHGRRVPGRWQISLFLRTLLILALVLGVSGVQLVLPGQQQTTIFVLDSSDSVALSQRARAEAFVQQALATMPADARAGITVFGKQALVERSPDQQRTLGQVVSQPGGAATEIAAALRLAQAQLPAEGQRRIVLISDGGATSGDALEQARLAQQAGIPIDVVALSGSSDGLDAQISSIELPAAARAGQQLRTRIQLHSSAATPARLTITAASGLVFDQAITLVAGPQVLEVVLPEAVPGFNRYAVRLEVPGDIRTQNNAAEAFSFITGRPQILVIEGSTGAAEQLLLALTAAGMEPTLVTPAAAPRQLLELASYDATILVDVPRNALPDASLSVIAQAVHELGRGLLMVGGPQSFGAGGWADTPIETALPVTMDIPPLLRIPPVSVVVVIDTSGSMSEQEQGLTKLELAVAGAQQIAKLLRDEDELTVIPFDDAPRDVVGPLPGSQRDQAIRSLERVQVGGGGIMIHDALAEAARVIRASSHPVRHIITITDGSDTTQQEGALAIIEGLRTDGVTLTTIAIGDGQDVPFIKNAAQAGGGRTFLTDRASNLPGLLVDETQALLRPYLIELTFAPVLASQHPALRAEQGMPQLHGFVQATPKASAQVVLAAPDRQPILAAWQYGLGRSLAWTSDLTGRWGKDLVQSESFPALTGRMVSWLLPTELGSGLELTTSSAGGVLALQAQAHNPDGTPATGLRLVARLFARDGGMIDIQLRETAAGHYQTTVSDQAPGAYLVQLVASSNTGEPVGVLTAGVIVPLSVEYRTGTANPALLEEIAHISGGRVEPDPAQSFDRTGVAAGAPTELSRWLLWFALVLLPIDIAVRRLLRIPALAQARPTKPPAVSMPAQPIEAAAPQPVQRPAPAANQQLERLREEQERARKRARGEE